MLESPVIKKYNFLVFLPIIWLGATTITVFLLTILLLLNNGTKNTSFRYSMFSSKPLVLGAMSASTGHGDPRAAKIDQVFEQYNCPLTGMGSVFVEEADKNNIPYWVVAAISFQESSCGKQIPYVDDRPSYNAWGWAVYGDMVREFDSWEDGIRVVSKYMNERFFSQGVTDLCVIMKTYTPPSQGSWCKGVDYFKDVIDEYKSPIL